MKKNDAQSIYEKLQSLNIPFEKAEHAAAMTMEDLAEVEVRLSAPFCKNLFLCNRQKTEFFLLLITGTKKFRTAEVSKKIGKARLSFGEAETLYQLLGVLPGAISPMGLIFDREHTVQVIADKDLLHSEYICVHPCVNTESIKLKTSDLFDGYLKHTGHAVQFIEITGEE